MSSREKLVSWCRKRGSKSKEGAGARLFDTDDDRLSPALGRFQPGVHFLEHFAHLPPLRDDPVVGPQGGFAAVLVVPDQREPQVEAADPASQLGGQRRGLTQGGRERVVERERLLFPRW